MQKSTIWALGNRLFYSEQAEQRHARPAVRVALLGVMISVAVMLLTVFVVLGFKRTVTEQVAGFSSHIQVVNFDNNNTYELRDISPSDTLLQRLQSVEHVVYADPFVTKPGILKTQDSFQGVVLKGMPLFQADRPSAWDFFRHNLREGSMPDSVGDVLLSKTLHRLLQVGVGESLLCYFVGDDVRVRRYHVCGIYETGFEDFDRAFLLTPIDGLRQLNGWDSTRCSGIEIRVDDVNHLEEVDERVFFITANRFDSDGNAFFVQNLLDKNPQIFMWLDLLDMNVVIIFILMLCVSGFSMISGLLILILDSVPFIGTMKALGMDNRTLRKIFLVEAFMLVGRGVLWGNLIGCGLMCIQYFTHLIPLDAATYYVGYVPVLFSFWGWLLVNIAAVTVSMLVLLLPSALVTRISPAQVLRFE